jgi:hypothetical protein
MYRAVFVDGRSTGIYRVKNHEIRNILLFLLDIIHETSYKVIINFCIIKTFRIELQVSRETQRF